ncbi:MAG: hypothetical protein M3R63_05095 [Actinomycetota bacterium]|nr:hypothetical protein [Actinomycetota bacterium]
MTFYTQPDRELTEEEKLLTEIIGVSQWVPCGGRICLGLSLDTAREMVDKLFTERRQALMTEPAMSLMRR